MKGAITVTSPLLPNLDEFQQMLETIWDAAVARCPSGFVATRRSIPF